MKLKKTIRIAGSIETYCGKKDDCNITITHYDIKSDKPWYFVISHMHRIFSYNSNWEKEMFPSKEECLIAAENKLKELVKLNFPDKYDSKHTSHLRMW